MNLVLLMFSMRTAAIMAAVLCVFLSATNAHAEVPAPVLKVIESYQYQNHDEWSRILFYHPSVLGKPSSLIDAPDFFLAADGANNPKAELLAFTRHAFSDQPERRKVQCRFPRRTKYLLKALGGKLQIPPADCPEFRSMKATGIYVVFSSYFLESPASYFGHIFLRVEKRGSDEKHNALLDPIISFGAKHGDVNVLNYVAGGLLGWFPGVYEVAPMHMKIQQYNNYESRDLWEYRLNLTEEQLGDLELSLFEVMPAYSDYYYLSRNCSLLIAKLIEAVEPRVQFSAGSRVWTSPIEAMKQLVQTLGEPKPSSVRASSRRRFLAKSAGLTESEFGLVKSMIDTDSIVDISTLSLNRQAEVLETLVEFIEFDQNLAGPAKAEKYSLLRQRALFARAKNPSTTQINIEIPERENPVLIIPEKSIRIGVLYAGKKSYGLIGVRPSLKALNSTSTGFMLGMGIHVFDVDVYMDKEELGLHEFDLLLLENYQAAIPLKSGIGGGVRFSFGRLHHQPAKPYSLDIEFSRNYGWGNSHALGFFEYGIYSHFLSGKDRNHLGFFPGLGVVAEWEKVVKASAKVRVELNAMNKFKREPIIELGMSSPFGDLNDLEASAKVLHDSYSVSVKYNRFLR